MSTEESFQKKRIEIQLLKRLGLSDVQIVAKLKVSCKTVYRCKNKNSCQVKPRLGRPSKIILSTKKAIESELNDKCGSIRRCPKKVEY